MAIEDVVLQDEEDVEKDGEKAQTKLCYIAEDALPVVVVVGLQEVVKQFHNQIAFNHGKKRQN